MNDNTLLADFDDATAIAILSGVDADVQNYINALTTAGVTPSQTVQGYINTFITGLKNNGIWSSIYCLYPFIGGTAATHAINAKSPGTYNINWSGTVTHSSNGSVGDGSTGYGDTQFTIATNLPSPQAACAMGCYVNSVNTYNNRIDMGVTDLSNYWWLGSWYNTSTNKSFIQGYYVSTQLNSSSYGPGFYVANHINGQTVTLYQNGTSVGTATDNVSFTPPSDTVYLLAGDVGQAAAQHFTANPMYFAFIGIALTPTQVSNLSSLVNALQTSLGRNLY